MFEPKPTKPYPTLAVPAFHSDECCCRGLPLSALDGDASPVMYADCLLSRREPTFVFVFDASLFAFAFDTPPFAFALL